MSSSTPRRPGSRRSWQERLSAMRETTWWHWLKRGLVLSFFALVAGLLIDQARDIEWSKVADSMSSRSLPVLLLAAGLAALSHLIYSSFDLFGRKVTRHELPARRVMATASVSYVFNLNLGALIGGMGFRYRLYSRQGLKPGTITTVVATSILTNWLGYLLLGGVVLLFYPPDLPQQWSVAGAPLKVAAVLMIAAAVTWQIACAVSPRREWHVFDHPIRLPGARLAALQLVASTVNWAVIGGVVYVVLGREVAYPMVLGTLLVAAVAGVIAHVPAGLGVLEAVFVALLGASVARSDLIGALLLYRAIYYLAPLAVAALMLWRLEATAGEVADGASSEAPAPRPSNAAASISS